MTARNDGGLDQSGSTTASDTRSHDYARILGRHLEELQDWQANWPAFELDDTLGVSSDALDGVLSELVGRLTDNFPYFHPGYAGQMLKPPHPVATLAYALAQTINPNNHANDGGPATSKMEFEVVDELAAMFGFDRHVGHLTGGGTVANLEALWVGRQLRPGKSVAYSSQAHYTHGRMAGVLGVPAVPIPVDFSGRMDLNVLESRLATGEVGTVVATAGTTSFGSVDPIPEMLALARQHGARLHVDAAYGGYYRLLADSDQYLAPEDAASFRAIRECDSVVVDPHKHGLQPYGCGSVLFNDPAVASLYRHDSSYTYFTDVPLHLGEISLECSRAGAAAAALWATLKLFPLRADSGLGPVLAKCRSAATRWAALIGKEDRLRLAMEPAIDIICFYPTTFEMTATSISARADRIFAAGMADPTDPVYLAKMSAGPEILRDPGIVWDAPTVTILRSCLLKPEHDAEIARLNRRVVELATL